MKQRWAVKPPPPLNEHEAAYIEHGRMKAWVDRKILPLVLACWKRGWETEMCCENIFPGAAHIVFLRYSNLQAFMEAISTASLPPLKEEIVSDKGWMTLWGYEPKGPFVWASEQSNGVLFPLAFAPAFHACVSERKA